MISPKSAAELASEDDELRDAQPLTTSCAFCSWRFVGLVREGRERAAAHRKAKHPELAKMKSVRPGARYRIRRS